MNKFVDEFDSEYEILESVNKINIDSMAGEDYINHISQINKMINKANENNAASYRKASFCAVG